MKWIATNRAYPARPLDRDMVQGENVGHGSQGFQHRAIDGSIDADDRHGLSAGPVAGKLELADIHAVVAQDGAQLADHSGLIHVDHGQHMSVGHHLEGESVE